MNKSDISAVINFMLVILETVGCQSSFVLLGTIYRDVHVHVLCSRYVHVRYFGYVFSYTCMVASKGLLCMCAF